MRYARYTEHPHHNAAEKAQEGWQREIERLAKEKGRKPSTGRIWGKE